MIMNENPWKAVGELLREKRSGGNSGMNAAMARGVALEPSARAAYCSHFGRTVEPSCLESIEWPWMRASVDGLSICGTHLVEIKCGQSVYKKTAQTGAPPGYYFGQLQHALAVTGLEVMDFLCFLPGVRPLHIVIRRNDAYIKRLIEAEERFFEQHLKLGSVDRLDDLV